MDVYRREQNGLVLALGASPRPSRDRREDRYAFGRTTVPLRTADLSQPRLLSRVRASDGELHDYRVPITNQGSIGSCACWTTAECAEMSANLTGRRWEAVHPGWLYEVVRRYEGTFPADAGSYLADNLDIAMNGMPPLSDYAYVQQAAFDYPERLDSNRAGQDYVLGHRPFYPSDGEVLSNIWTALDQQMPIALGMTWLSEFFTPLRGILPAGLSAASSNGGHAITLWGIVPNFLLCANHWSSFWAADAATSGLPDMRPGDFAIPWEYATRTAPLLWEYRAVVAEPVAAPVPGPVPDPAVLPWVQWQQQAAAYVEAVYAAGDLASAQTWQAQLAQYAPVIESMMSAPTVATAVALPERPPRR